MSGSNLCECWCSRCESNGGGCCHELYPLLEHTADELATLARFDATEPAPESHEAQVAYAEGRWCGECRYGVVESPPCCHVRQHRTADCWCNPTLIPGTLGTWQHRKVDE